MSALDDFRGRVQATLWSAAGWVSQGGIEEAQHLVDHGEPAEGMRTLAWIIVDERTMVPMDLIRAIRALSEGLVAAEHMPANLEDFGVDEDLSCE